MGTSAAGGDWAEALKRYDEALIPLRRGHGENHPLVRATEVEKSNTLSGLGHHDAAIALLRRVFEAPGLGRPGEDGGAVLAREALGLALKAAGRDVEARDMLEEVVRLRSGGRFGRADEPPGLIALAQIEIRAAQFDKARKYADAALAILETAPGTGLDLLGEARRVRVDVALADGDITLAEQLIEDNLRAAEMQMVDLARSTAYAACFTPRALREQVGQALDLGWGDGRAPDVIGMFRAAQLLQLNEVTQASNGLLEVLAEDPVLSPLLDRRRVLSETLAAMTQERAQGGDAGGRRLEQLTGLRRDMALLDDQLFAMSGTARRCLRRHRSY